MKPISIDDMKVMSLGLGRSIYSPVQLEEFARFQESQGTRRAFLAESEERAYNGRVGGQWGSGLTDLATESLIDAVGYHLVQMYLVIGPTVAVALLVLFLVGILRMTLDIVIRAIAIARTRGCGWWLMGAFWGTLFQVAVAHAKGAMAKGHTVGRAVTYQMAAEAARLKIEDVEAQRLSLEEVDGPSAPKMRLNSLDRLVNWSNEFHGRRDTDRIYPVPIIRDEHITMGNSAADRDTEDENSKRGQPTRH
jgi:hypothetical protein